jgi:hypothetical protein
MDGSTGKVVVVLVEGWMVALERYCRWAQRLYYEWIRQRLYFECTDPTTMFDPTPSALVLDGGDPN